MKEPEEMTPGELLALQARVTFLLGRSSERARLQLTEDQLTFYRILIEALKNAGAYGIPPAEGTSRLVRAPGFDWNAFQMGYRNMHRFLAAHGHAELVGPQLIGFYHTVARAVVDYIKEDVAWERHWTELKAFLDERPIASFSWGMDTSEKESARDQLMKLLLPLKHVAKHRLSVKGACQVLAEFETALEQSYPGYISGGGVALLILASAKPIEA